MLILGIDDAGRGPLIGPMILAGVLLTEDQEKFLKKKGVNDSKLLKQKKRVELAKLIQKNSMAHFVTKAFPSEIDTSINSGINLNTLEAIKTAEIINQLNNNQEIKLIIDCPSPNLMKWKNLVLNKIKDAEKINIICEHKADSNYPSVSAASILAKVAREDEVEKLKNLYGNLGSGYGSDPITQEFLRTNGKKLMNSGIFRKSWYSWKLLFPEEGQSTLEGFK